MRLVIDTNVIVSGFCERDSVPGRILEAGLVGKLELCAPQSVRDELRRVMVSVLSMSPLQVDLTLRLSRIEWIPARLYEGRMAESLRLVRDPDDAPVLACALAIGCDIVSGEKDLHAARIPGLRVWRPSELGRR